MPEEQDLLRKADALLARYRSGTQANLPLLTDVVELANVADPSSPPVLPSDASRQDTDLHRFGNDVGEAVVNELSTKIDRFLAQSLPAIIRSVLDDATEAISSKVREEAMHRLAVQLPELVNKVIQSEIVRASKAPEKGH